MLKITPTVFIDSNYDTINALLPVTLSLHTRIQIFWFYAIFGRWSLHSVWLFYPFISSTRDVLPLVLGFQLNNQETMNTSRGATSCGKTYRSCSVTVTALGELANVQSPVMFTTLPYTAMLKHILTYILLYFDCTVILCVKYRLLH